LPGTIEPSKEKRHCGADDCNEQLVGTSIGHHYRSRTDFDKLKVLRNLPRQLAEEELKIQIQSRTTGNFYCTCEVVMFI